MQGGRGHEAVELMQCTQLPAEMQQALTGHATTGQTTVLGGDAESLHMRQARRKDNATLAVRFRG